MIQVQNAFSAKIRLYVVLESFFGKTIAADKFKAKLPHIKKMVTTPLMPPAELFFGFEVYYKQNPDSRKAYPNLLKELYDGEIVKEEVMTAHYAQDLDTDGFAECKAAATPFLEWLANADSDSSSEEGSEDGDDSDVDLEGI